MPGRARSALVLLAALLAAGATSQPATAQPGLPTVVQDDATLLRQPPDQVEAAMQRIRALGVSDVRLSANWSLIAPAPDSATRPSFDATDPAAYEQANWGALDFAVGAAQRAGLRVMIDVAFWAPRWATTDQGPRARTNVAPRDFADFAVAVARRYSGSFTLPLAAAAPAPAPSPPPRDQSLLDKLLGVPPPPAAAPAPPPPTPVGQPLPEVDTFVLWNEPNHPAFLLPQWSAARATPRPLSADVYRAMVVAAYPAVKAVRPASTVLIGNTSGSGAIGNPHAVPPLRFLRQLACVDERLVVIQTGSCANFTPVPGDGWAHHPYSNDRPDIISSGHQSDNARIGDLGRLSTLIDRLIQLGRLAPGVHPVYITEYGFETQPPSGPARLTKRQAELDQAHVLVWAEYIATHIEAVKMFAQFLLRDVPPSSQRQSDSPRRGFGQFYTGLERADGVLKPAGRSFRAGLFAQRLGRGAVALFGRLRLGPGACQLAIQSLVPGGRWTPLATGSHPRAPKDASFTQGCGDVFERYTALAPGIQFRLLYRLGAGPWRRGLGVAPVRSTPRTAPPPGAAA